MKIHITKLWNAAKAVVRGKCIALSAYIKTEEKSQISNMHYPLRKQKNKPKARRRKK